MMILYEYQQPPTQEEMAALDRYMREEMNFTGTQQFVGATGGIDKAMSTARDFLVQGKVPPR